MNHVSSADTGRRNWPRGSPRFAAAGMPGPVSSICMRFAESAPFRDTGTDAAGYSCQSMPMIGRYMARHASPHFRASSA